MSSSASISKVLWWRWDKVRCQEVEHHHDHHHHHHLLHRKIILQHEIHITKHTNNTAKRTRSYATAKSTAHRSCLVGVLYDISREKICWWLISHFYPIGHEATEFGKITQNNGHYAVQGNSRSAILVSIESPYATSY